MDKFEAYFQAASQSFAGQTNTLTIPQSRPGEIYHRQLGFQPHGIASRTLGDGRDLVALTHFGGPGGPAVALIMVERTTEGLHCQFNWIREALHQGQSVRLFPNISEPSGVNRLYTVNFGPDDMLWISRGDREFFILEPPEGEGQKWKLADGTVVLPALGGDRDYYSMEAALRLSDGVLFTIEASPDLQRWLAVKYQPTADKDFVLVMERPIPAWSYGIGVDRDDALWTTTDYRFYGPPGLRRHGILIKTPVTAGNGICFLSDDSALVTVYGTEYLHVPGGLPGELIHVPAGYF